MNMLCVWKLAILSLSSEKLVLLNVDRISIQKDKYRNSESIFNFYDYIISIQISREKNVWYGFYETSESTSYKLVYKFRKIIGKNDFLYHFKKIVVRYKKIGYNINVMRQTACLVVNPIKINGFAYLFNCTTVGRTSDWMMVPS